MIIGRSCRLAASKSMQIESETRSPWDHLLGRIRLIAPHGLGDGTLFVLCIVIINYRDFYRPHRDVNK